MTIEGEVTPGSQGALRNANRQRVVEAVRDGRSLTQAEIARTTGLSAATVSNVVRDLRAMGTVAVRSTSSGGRRARAVTLLRQPGVVVGIDFGISHLRVGVGGTDGALLAQETIDYDVAADAPRGIRRAVWLVDTVLTRARIDHSMVMAVAAAVPGPLETATGRVGTATIMPAWSGVRPADELSQRLNLPVRVDNEANLCAYAELTEGAGRGAEHLIYVNLSHGVGSGIIVGGQVYQGAGGTAGEIGHIALDDRGQVCRCGNRGCLETLAGGPYLLNMLPPHVKVGDPPTLAALIAGALDMEPGCRRIVAEAGTAVGRGIAMVANLFNPQLVVVGGELVAAGDLLLEPMRRSVELGALGSALRDMRLVPGELGERGPLRGALAYALSGSAEKV